MAQSSRPIRKLEATWRERKNKDGGKTETPKEEGGQDTKRGGGKRAKGNVDGARDGGGEWNVGIGRGG